MDGEMDLVGMDGQMVLDDDYEFFFQLENGMTDEEQIRQIQQNQAVDEVIERVPESIAPGLRRSKRSTKLSLIAQEAANSEAKLAKKREERARQKEERRIQRMIDYRWMKIIYSMHGNKTPAELKKEIKNIGPGETAVKYITKLLNYRTTIPQRISRLNTLVSQYNEILNIIPPSEVEAAKIIQDKINKIKIQITKIKEQNPGIAEGGRRKRKTRRNKRTKRTTRKH